jgi:tetratricopeptide (TPR) repeat protein
MPLPLPELIAVVLIALGPVGMSGLPGPVARTHASTGSSSAAPGVVAGAPSYREILDRYRAGAFAEAVGDLLSDPHAHSAAIVMRDLELIADKDAVLPAAAAMHLEAGYEALRRADETRGGGHLEIARSIVTWGRWDDGSRGQDEARRRAALRRDIDLGLLWTMQTYRWTAMTSPHLRRLGELYPRDPDVLVALGWFDELRSTPLVRNLNHRAPDPDADVVPRETRKKLRNSAIEHYRAALSEDPVHAEASVRLGRVLQLQGDLKQAREAFEDAVVLEPPMVMHYLGSMFLAEVMEMQGDAEGALARYQAIVARWPGCQSAHLALSRAHAARGERDAASRVLAPLWREPLERACRDPWWIYGLGQAWRYGGLVESLRARVRA